MNKKYLIIGGLALGIGALVYWSNKKSKEKKSDNKGDTPNGTGGGMAANIKVDDVQVGSETTYCSIGKRIEVINGIKVWGSDDFEHNCLPKKIDINKIQDGLRFGSHELVVLGKYNISKGIDGRGNKGFLLETVNGKIGFYNEQGEIVKLLTDSDFELIKEYYAAKKSESPYGAKTDYES
jgi:hypothetical protein